MATTDHTWGLTSPTVSNVPALCCLIPVQLLTGVLVDHAAHGNRVERRDRLTTPAYSASDEQGRDVEAILVIIYRTDGIRIMEMKDTATLEAFFSLAFLLFTLFLSL